MSHFQLTRPILFLIFNRPETTLRVFDAIREARPPSLYVAADGPRPDKPGEEELCKEVRRVIQMVDWDCEVKTLFRDENLGCGRAVMQAIDWFFDNEEEGIILEDDCVPTASFFRYCDELLTRYRNDPRVMVISGDNFQFGIRRGTGDYYFSIYNHVWGWASWKRAWNLYDRDMVGWPEAREQGVLNKLFPERHISRYWMQMLDRTYRGEIDTWDYQWMFSCWLHGGLAVLPNVNLVSNLGFGDAATHTFGGSLVADIATGELDFPLNHPAVVERDVFADRRTFRFNCDNRIAIRLHNRFLRLVRDMKNGYFGGR